MVTGQHCDWPLRNHWSWTLPRPSHGGFRSGPGSREGHYRPLGNGYDGTWAFQLGVQQKRIGRDDGESAVTTKIASLQTTGLYSKGLKLTPPMPNGGAKKIVSRGIHVHTSQHQK